MDSYCLYDKFHFSNPFIFDNDLNQENIELNLFQFDIFHFSNTFISDNDEHS